jgi:hypothetical protein
MIESGRDDDMWSTGCFIHFGGRFIPPVSMSCSQVQIASCFSS